MKKIYIAAILASAILAASAAFAVPANETKVYTLKQPDGCTFKASQRGDEYAHWIFSADTGWIIVRDNETGWWNFALVKDDRLVSSGVHFCPCADPPKGAVKRYSPPARRRPLR